MTSRDGRIRKQWITILDICFDISDLKGWDHDALSKRSGIHPSTLRRWYNEEFKYIHTDTVGRLFDAVGIDIASIVEAGVTYPSAKLSKAA